MGFNFFDSDRNVSFKTAELSFSKDVWKGLLQFHFILIETGDKGFPCFFFLQRHHLEDTKDEHSEIADGISGNKLNTLVFKHQGSEIEHHSTDEIARFSTDTSGVLARDHRTDGIVRCAASIAHRAVRLWRSSQNLHINPEHWRGSEKKICRVSTAKFSQFSKQNAYGRI